MFWQIYDTLSNNILNVVFRCVLRFIGHGQFAVFQVACLAVNLNQIQFWRPGKATCFLRRCWRNEIFKCGGIIDDVLADRAAANFREIYKLLQPGDMGNLHSIVNLPSSPNPWGTRLIPMWEIPIVAQSSFPHVFFLKLWWPNIHFTGQRSWFMEGKCLQQICEASAKCGVKIRANSVHHNWRYHEAM